MEDIGSPPLIIPVTVAAFSSIDQTFRFMPLISFPVAYTLSTSPVKTGCIPILMPLATPVPSHYDTIGATLGVAILEGWLL